jgi:multidrug efflux pump subunit AcrB
LQYGNRWSFFDLIQNGQREMGLGIMAAIQYANRRRLRAILMTSLTTILALAPVLFTTGLGAELQQPLAVAVIGGLLVGTVASLYFLPLVYRALRPKREMERSVGK